MFDGIKREWKDSQSRLMKAELEKALSEMNGLSPQLRERSIAILFDAYDRILASTANFENITLEAKNKLMKAFRSDARNCYDYDRSKSLGLKLFSLWLESSMGDSLESKEVFKETNTFFRARAAILCESEEFEEEEHFSSKWRYHKFEDWYAVFKKTAGETNQQLKQSSDGVSMLDFMDQEPLHRAFRDKVEPESLAKSFANQYNFSTFVKP